MRKTLIATLIAVALSIAAGSVAYACMACAIEDGGGNCLVCLVQ